MKILKLTKNTFFNDKVIETKEVTKIQSHVATLMRKGRKEREKEHDKRRKTD